MLLDVTTTNTATHANDVIGHDNACLKTKQTCSRMLNSWLSACATPEKRRPAVPFRKQLCGCGDAEPAPSVWINVSPVGSPGSVNAAEVKEHAGRKQRGRPEPRVQIPAWISSGCWAPQWEGTLQGGAKKQKKKQQHRMSFQNTQSVSGHTDALMQP